MFHVSAKPVFHLCMTPLHSSLFLSPTLSLICCPVTSLSFRRELNTKIKQINYKNKVVFKLGEKQLKDKVP